MFILGPNGWSAATTLGSQRENNINVKALGMCGNNPCRVETNVHTLTQGCRVRSNPGLTLANALGVKTWANISQRP